jgi:DNA-binding Lrp family transcriptional regulator
MDDLKVQDLKKRIAAAVNEPDKDKQREMVQEIMDSPEMSRFTEVIQNAFDYICEIITEIIETLCEVLRPIVRVVIKHQRINSFRRQRIKYKRWCY